MRALMIAQTFLLGFGFGFITGGHVAMAQSQSQSDTKPPEPAKPAISEKHRKIAEEYCRIYPTNPACVKPKEEEKK